MTLEAVATSRAELPTFPGQTLLQQMLIGRQVAMATLLKYRPDLTFDVDGASQNFRIVDGWMDRNGAELEKVMADPNVATLPERIRLAFDKQTARDFVIAGFTMAAAGMGPWVSGAVAANTSAEWARADAAERLRVFGGIVQMENDGYLPELFNDAPPPQATGALGNPIVIAIATNMGRIVAGVLIAAVLTAAIIAAYHYAAKQLELNNRVMRDLCEKAQQQGDKVTVAACIEATKGLQNADFLGLKSLGKTLAVGALLIGGAWLALTYGPALLAKKKS